MITDITKLVSLILGISLAGERLVTLIKTIFPHLAAPPASAGDRPDDSPSAIFKKVLLMVIAFLCCWLSAQLLFGIHNLTVTIGTIGPIYVWFLGLLASAGSAFWTNILGYLSALKDLNNQKALQAKMAFDAANGENTFSKNRSTTNAVHRKTDALKTIRFIAAFSGGGGTLKIQIDGMPDIDFTDDGYQDVDLPVGRVDFIVSGAASPGPNGKAVLTINNARNSNSPLTYGPGIINPDNQTMSV